MSRDAGDSLEDVLASLLDGDDLHVAEVDESPFDEVRDSQHPLVCCSESRVSQERMWDVDEPGTLFTVVNIGNRATIRGDDGRVLDGGVAYAVTFTGTGVVVIVGHTGCGALEAASEVVQDEIALEDFPPGVRQHLESLVTLVERAPVDLDGPKDAVVDRLVMAHVCGQVGFVAAETDAAVYGFVYDVHHRYGDEDGRAYLVTAADEELPDAIEDDEDRRELLTPDPVLRSL